ncbi:MAG: sigma-54 dependent transcriptional regulator [Spirochaetaceae bacterium]
MNKTSIRILIVDDDITLVSLLKDLLETKGYSIHIANSCEEAEEKLNFFRYHVVVSDFIMPNKNGLELLKICNKSNHDIQFIMVTAFGSIQNAVEALKLGAFHYLTKPIQIEELLIVIEKAIKHGKLTTQNQFLSAELQKNEEFLFESHSSQYISLLKNVEKLKPVDSTVLLHGETGTGKEVMARLIHNTSVRSKENFVPINCGALPESLLESELFGFDKGAFTGATKEQMGKLEYADGGTLFLDEVEAMSPKAQVSLLRFLQEGEITRLGSNKKIKLNVRVIAATNKDLMLMCRENLFREDLYYRISVFPLDIPPLRERKEDIVMLAEWILSKLCTKLSRNIKGFSNEAKESLVTYNWPGNIRELKNCLERGVIVESGNQLENDSLFLRPLKTLPMKFDDIGLIPLKQLEDSYINWALDKLDGNKTLTSETLGISPRGLYYKLGK